MRKIIITNNKGGVGKTNIATQILFHLARKGHSVIGVDLDAQCNFTEVLHKFPVVGQAVELVTEGKALTASLQPGEIGIVAGYSEMNAQTDEGVLEKTCSGIAGLSGADFCVIDTPPTFPVIVYGAMAASDYLLVPVQMKRHAIQGIEKVVEAFMGVREINEHLDLVGFLPSCYHSSWPEERQNLKLIIEEYHEVMVPHAIRLLQAYESAQKAGVPIWEIPTQSGKAAAREFEEFMDWLYPKLMKG